MVKLHVYGAGWTVPCISPYVTKVSYYMDLVGIGHELVGANPFTLKNDTPHGKLPTIEDDDGTLVADSTAIIRYFEATRPGLDRDADVREKARMHAFNRMLDEHLYWAAVIQPRWHEQSNWETYVPIICGGNQPDAGLRTALEDFRRMILAEFDGQGMGRLPPEKIYERARQDIDALSDQLGGSTYFMGEDLRSIDANVLSMLKHTLETPFAFDTKDYIATKPNLVDYVARLSAKVGDAASARQAKAA